MRALVPLLGSRQAALPGGSKQMANGPRKTAFTLGSLCCRLDCYSALTVSSKGSWECKTQVGKSSPIFTEQVTGSEEHLARWELACTLANCYCVLSLREEMGEGRAPLQPRGSPPGAHVVNSMCWEMPACVAPHLARRLNPCLTKLTKQTGSPGGVFPGRRVMGEEVASGRCYAVVLLLIWERCQAALRLWEHFRFSMHVPAFP